jgi:hypothetical protein
VTSSRAVLVRVERILATLSAFQFILMLFWHDGIEALFGVDPDKGDGSLEVAIPVFLLACTIALGLCARHEWRARRRIGAPLAWSRRIWP